MRKTRLIVGITGSSGALLGIRLLQVVRKNRNIETHLVISNGANTVIEQETNFKRREIEALASYSYPETDMTAAIASGSFLTEGMIVIPCSMKTLAGIATGYSENLVLRAADVTLKERRKLVLVVRESPLSAIHFENMLKLSRLGVVILPATPSFYTKPKTLEDIVDFTVGRALDIMGIEHSLFKRWGEHASH